MRKLLLLVMLVFSVNSFAVTHTYYFKLQGVTTPSQAKQKIDQMRTILGIKMFAFDDVTDTFKTITELEYNWEDMIEDLESNGIFIDGIVEDIITG